MQSDDTPACTRRPYPASLTLAERHEAALAEENTTLRALVAKLTAENRTLRSKLRAAKTVLSTRSKLRVCREIARRNPIDDHRCNVALPQRIKRKMWRSGGCYPMSAVGSGSLILMRCEHYRLIESYRESKGCWEWIGQINPITGYGTFNWDRRGWMAHRFLYALMVGPIRFGFTLDHTCHSEDATCPGGRECQHRRCVNPAHLEQLTLGDNVRRKPSVRLTAPA